MSDYGVFETKEAMEEFESALADFMIVAAKLWKKGEPCIKDITFEKHFAGKYGDINMETNYLQATGTFFNFDPVYKIVSYTSA